MMFARAADDAEEEVEDNQRQPAGQPAAGELAENHLPARHRLGQQREDGAVLALGRDLAGGGADGDHQRGNPDQQQRDLLHVTDDLGIVKEAHRPHHQRDDRGEDEEDVEVLAPVQFLDDNA